MSEIPIVARPEAPTGGGPGAFAGSRTLLVRMAGLAVLFGFELLVFSVQTNPTALAEQGGVIQLVHPGHIWRALIAFSALAVSFGLITARREFQRISGLLAAMPVSWRLLTGHAGAAIVFTVVSKQLEGGVNRVGIAGLLPAAWFAAGILAVALGWLAMVPWKVCCDLLRSARAVWIVAAIGALFAVGIEDLRPLLWGRVIGLTVNLVRIMLHPFVPDLAVNPEAGTFLSPRFGLTITPECAGFEGAGLMLAFGIVWLLVCRKECRFPHALFIIPVSVVAAWLLNSVRLAALFLIGNAGAPSVALGGFHSQAGWIAFSGVALGFTQVLQRVPALSKAGLGPASERRAANPSAWYLMPFLAILATAMAVHAASAGFEQLYPLRFLAAALVLFHYRRRYATLDWRFGREALVGGVAVFAMWLGLERVMPSGSGAVIAAGLAAMSLPARITWISLRVLSATVTVPIAEELAFRGFLLRRLVSADFERVARQNTFPALIVSSIAFGCLHGNRWMAGTIAGLVYGWAFRRRRRIGDAVAAHAITNGMLAAWVLLTGSWQLW